MRVLEYRRSKLARIAQRDRQEIGNTGLARRDLMEMGLLTRTGHSLAKAGLSSRESGIARGGDAVVSLPTTLFIEPLLIPPVKHRVASLSPPQLDPLPDKAGHAPRHVLTRFHPRRLYEVHQRQTQHGFHPGLPTG